MNLSKNKSVLIFSEAVTLAHVSRPLKVAQELALQNFKIIFASTNIPRILQNAVEPFNFHILPNKISESSFLKSIARGRHPFTIEILKENVQIDRELIQKIKPDLVIGDMRLSLVFSARLERVPYVNLSNLTWDPSFEQKRAIPDLPVVRTLGLAAANLLYPLIYPLVQKELMRPFNAIAKLHGFQLFENYYDILSTSDLTLYFDLLSFKTSAKLSEKKQIIGALDFSFSIPIENEKSFELEFVLDLPKVLIYLGSSGPNDLLPIIGKVLPKIKANFIIITGKEGLIKSENQNVKYLSFANFEKLLPTCALTICNGGSPTGYAALKHGVPILTIPSNVDQMQFSELMIERGVGRKIRRDFFAPNFFEEEVKEMLQNSSYTLAAKTIAQEISATRSSDLLRAAILDFMQSQII